MLHYFPLIFVGASLVIGAIAYTLIHRRRATALDIVPDAPTSDTTTSDTTTSDTTTSDSTADPAPDYAR